MNLQDIKKAVNNGLPVYWKNKNFKVDGLHIKYSKGFARRKTPLSFEVVQGDIFEERLNGESSDFFVDLSLKQLISGIEGGTIWSEACMKSGAVLGCGAYHYVVDSRLNRSEKEVLDYCKAQFSEPMKRVDVPKILSIILKDSSFFMELTDGTLIKANL